MSITAELLAEFTRDGKDYAEVFAIKSVKTPKDRVTAQELLQDPQGAGMVVVIKIWI